MQNKISVVLSTYNEEIAFVEESINSILQQTYRHFELILINDNPKREELDAVLKNYAQADTRINYVVNPQNIGLVSSLNKAIKIAQGDYIARMDADDVSDRSRLEKEISYLESENLDLVGSFINKIDEQGKIIDKLDLPVQEKYIKRYLRWGSCLLHPTWLCKKELYEKLNGYRNIAGAEDYDFVLRAVLYGYKVGNINQYLLNYRIRESSISTSNSARQQLTADFLAESYGKKSICTEESLSEYLHSQKYLKSLHKLEACQRAIESAKSRNSLLKSIIRMCGNKYFYKTSVQHIMKKHYTEAGK